MKLKDLIQDLAVREIHASPDLEISDVAYDSRNVAAGGLFVAISGFKTDGYRFIPAAIEKGAAAVVCERPPQQDIPYLLVSSAREALAQIGANRFGHPADSMICIGVTGTNGKTSVTTILKSVLEKTVGAKVGLIGTIENRIGDRVIPTERTTPESYELQKLIAEMKAEGCTHLIMEVSSHALCLNRVDSIRYSVAAFTNLTEDHLDFHGTMENYRDAKALLFSRCEKAVINMDDPAGAFMLAKAPCETVQIGILSPADLRGEDLILHADSVEMTVSDLGEKYKVLAPIPGKFTAYNLLTVLGIVKALGIPVQKAVDALRETRGVSGRIEVVPTPGMPYTVLIDYAHTPDALENILKSVRGFCKGRLMVLFGCGGDRDPIKRPIMGKIALDLSDFVIFTSDNPRSEDPMKIISEVMAPAKESKTPFYLEEDRRKAIRWAMDHAEAGDILVLAGKGHETYQERCGVKYHLDEREEVAAHLQELAEEKK